MDPQDDPELVHKIGALTDEEFSELVTKARGVTKESAAQALSRYVKRNTVIAKGDH